MVDYAHPERPDERLSHADRDAAVADLTRHEADGRITADELKERGAAAASAKTRGELSPLFSDLPSLPDARAPQPGQAQPGAAQPGPAQPSPAQPGPAQPGAARPSPAQHPAPQQGAQQQAFAPPYGAYPRDRDYRHEYRDYRRGRYRGRPLGGRVGASIMAATPIVAVVLFFITGFIFTFAWSWMWFLMVPVVGAIIYAPWYEEDDE